METEEKVIEKYIPGCDNTFDALVYLVEKGVIKPIEYYILEASQSSIRLQGTNGKVNTGHIVDELQPHLVKGGKVEFIYDAYRKWLTMETKVFINNQVFVLDITITS